MLLAEFGMALLAGIGINEFHRPEENIRAWARRGIAASFAILTGCGLTLILFPGVQVASITAIALVGLWGLTTGLLFLYKPESEGSKKSIWSGLLILVITLDLLITGWGLNPGIDPFIYNPSAKNEALANPLLNGQRIYLDSGSEDQLKFNAFFQFNDFSTPIDQTKLMASLLPDSNILVGMASANNFDPILPERYVRWMDYLNQTIDLTTRSRMLSLMDVGAVETIAPNLPAGVTFTHINSELIQWTGCGIDATSEQDAWNKTIGLLNNQTTKDQPNSIILENIGSRENNTCNLSQTATASITGQSANEIDVFVDSSINGWLMLSNTWYPGWKAYINNLETPVVRADFLFLAANVPAGKHYIQFRYQPESFYWGAGLSIIGLILLSLAFIFHKR